MNNQEESGGNIPQTEHITFNPNISDVPDENLEKIKGDAIGDTLYSERSVLKILIKLNECFTEEWSEETESDLCLLWDMTLDKDVVNFIAEQNFIEFSTEIIKFTSNIRLTEILVGIQGNMCCVEEIRHNFPSSSLDVLLSLFETRPDALTLLQVVRLIHSISWDLHSRTTEGHWLDNETNITKLSAHLSFILTSSTNEELLMSSMELVDTLCRIHVSDKDYSFYFANPETMRGLLECWRQVLGDWSYDDDFPSKTHHKMAQHWVAIMSSFSSHLPGRHALSDCADSVGDIVSKLIRRRFNFDDCILFPCVSILEAIVRLYFNEGAFIRLLSILHSLSSLDELNENDTELLECIENYCVNVSLSIDQQLIHDTLIGCNENHVLLFWKTVNERNNPELSVELGERSI